MCALFCVSGCGRACAVACIITESPWHTCGAGKAWFPFESSSWAGMFCAASRTPPAPHSTIKLALKPNPMLPRAAPRSNPKCVPACLNESASCACAHLIAGRPVSSSRGAYGSHAVRHLQPIHRVPLEKSCGLPTGQRRVFAH